MTTTTAAVDIQKEVRGYVLIFVSLLALTGLGVIVHILNPSFLVRIVLILGIATIQATLSACYFMHLISEKKLINWILLITFLNFVGMVIILLGAMSNPIHGTTHVT